MRTYTALIVAFILFTTMSSAQSVNWQWARTSSGTYGEGDAIALDSAGNIYAVGGFYDSISLGNQTIHSTGIPAYYRRIGSYVIAKYSPSGTLLSLMTTSLPITIWDLTIDDQGNQYTAGTMTTDTTQYRGVACLTKFNPSGQVLWTDTPVSIFSQAVNIAKDPSGYIYTIGYYRGSAISFGSYSLNNLNKGSVFMARYTSDGSPLWAETIVTDSATSISISAIATDHSGHIYYGGTYLGSDSISIGGTTIHVRQPNVLASYVTLYDTAGHMMWAVALQSPGGSGLTIQDIKTDQTGNAYVAGTYYGDSIVIGNMSIPASAGAGTLFVAKLDASGQPVWIKATSSGGTDGATVPEIAVSNQGQVFVSSGVSGTVVWDGHTLSTNQGNSQDLSILLTLDVNGNFLCGQMLPFGGDDGAYLIADRNGDACFVGDYMDSTWILGRDTLLAKPSGGENIFVARFNCPVSPAGINSLSQNSSLTVYPNPMTGIATATFTLPSSSGDAQIVIYDMLGRERRAYTLGNSDTEIQILAAGLSSGVYFCSLISDRQILSTKKVIIE